MNQINNVWIDGDYAVHAPGRDSLTNLGSLLLFNDGSSFDFATGEATDNKAGTPLAMVIFRLKNGNNTISYGSYNNNPQTHSWRAQDLHLDYPGKVEILPSPNGEIKVVENKHCHASLDGQSVRITKASRTEFTFLKYSGSTISLNFSGNCEIGKQESFPTLQVWAPSTCHVLGSAKSLTFKSLGSISLDTQEIRGYEVPSVRVNTTDDVTLVIDQTDQILIDGDDVKLTVKGHVGKIEVESSGDTTVNCLRVDDLNVTSMGFLNLDGDSVAELTADCSDEVTISLSSSKEIKISSRDCVNVTGGSLQDVDIEASDEVFVKADSVRNLDIDCRDEVTVEVKNADDIRLDCSDDAKLTLGNVSKVSVESMGRTTIKADRVDDIYISGSSDEVDIQVGYSEKLIVNSMDDVSIKVAEGTQNVQIDCSGDAKIALATANRVRIDSMGDVTVSAFKYLQDPVIDASGDERVRNR